MPTRHASESRVTRPILTRRVLRSDGTQAVGLQVFCGRTGASMSLDACRRCAAFLETSGDPVLSAASIRCLPPEAARASETEHTASRGGGLTVGSLLQEGPWCVRDDVSAPALLARFRERKEASLLVVDSRFRLVGVVLELALARMGSGAPLRPQAGYPGRRGLRRFRDAVAADVMTSAIAVAEHAKPADALRRMARVHLRSISVVTDDGVPLGVLWDVAMLRAYALESSAVAVEAPR